MSEEPKLKIIPFKKEVTPRADVIAALEDLLNKAKAGNLKAIYAAVLMTNGEVGTAYSSTENAFTAVGAIEWLKKRVMENV